MAPLRGPCGLGFSQELCNTAAMSIFGPFVFAESAAAPLAAWLVPLWQAGDVVCLKGPLGAGKTTLARALVRLAVADPDAEVPSPTFTLVQTYDAQPPLWHFDLYRLVHPDDLDDLGWGEARQTAVALVEWPERLGAALPADRLEMTLTPDTVSPDVRHLTFVAEGTWASRLAAAPPDFLSTPSQSLAGGIMP